MTLALRWGETSSDNAGMIWLDAVSLYTKNHKGQVAKHPIDAGAMISDHFIKENDVFNISAVITNVDISTGSYLIRDLENNRPYNSRDVVEPVSIKSTDQSILTKFLPDSIGQFLPERTPEVLLDSERTEVIERCQALIENLISGEIFNEKTGGFDSNIQLVSLFEYKKTILNKIINNLVITAVAFKEDANTGNALYCDFTLEKIRFSYLKKTVIPKDVSNALKKKAAASNDKGKQDSTPTTENGPKESDQDGLRSPYGKTVDQEFGLGGILNTGSL